MTDYCSFKILINKKKKNDMENLINSENLEEIRELIESKIADIPGHYILCGALGSLLLSAYLDKTGHADASSLIGKLAIPIIGIGLAKYKDTIKSAVTNQPAAQEKINTSDSYTESETGSTPVQPV